VDVAFGVPLELVVGPLVALALVLVLGVTLELGLVVLPLPWLPLDDEAGEVVVPVVVLGELDLVSAADGGVDGDGQPLGVLWAATVGRLGAVLPAAEGVGLTPEPSVVGALLDELLVKA
jgi:hypothetical protein